MKMMDLQFEWWMYVIVAIIVFFIFVLLHFTVQKYNEARIEDRLLRLYGKISASTQVQTALIDLETKKLNKTMKFSKKRRASKFGGISLVFSKEDNYSKKKFIPDWKFEGSSWSKLIPKGITKHNNNDNNLTRTDNSVTKVTENLIMNRTDNVIITKASETIAITSPSDGTVLVPGSSRFFAIADQDVTEPNNDNSQEIIPESDRLTSIRELTSETNLSEHSNGTDQSYNKFLGSIYGRINEASEGTNKPDLRTENRHENTPISINDEDSLVHSDHMLLNISSTKIESKRILLASSNVIPTTSKVTFAEESKVTAGESKSLPEDSKGVPEESKVFAEESKVFAEESKVILPNPTKTNLGNSAESNASDIVKELYTDTNINNLSIAKITSKFSYPENPGNKTPVSEKSDSLYLSNETLKPIPSHTTNNSTDDDAQLTERIRSKLTSLKNMINMSISTILKDKPTVSAQLSETAQSETLHVLAYNTQITIKEDKSEEKGHDTDVEKSVSQNINKS